MHVYNAVVSAFLPYCPKFIVGTHKYGACIALEYCLFETGSRICNTNQLICDVHNWFKQYLFEKKLHTTNTMK